MSLTKRRWTLQAPDAGVGAGRGSAPLRALIADDERLLREQIKARLAQVWPELVVCAEARDGLEAVSLADQHRPDIVFLDIRMPGMTGIEAAREIASLPDWSGELVFVTAYDEYAVAAFEQGALDYLLKPVEAERLAQTAQRLRSRLASRSGGPSAATGPVAGRSETELDALFERLRQVQQHVHAGQTRSGPTRWLQAGSGNTTRMVDVHEVLFFRSDEKYTRVQTLDAEYLIRTPIRDLIAQLEPDQFWQIHRSTIVRVSAISAVVRDETGRQRVHLKQFAETLEVSRGFAHLFRAG